MDGDIDIQEPSRRGVLALLGAAALTPVAVTLLDGRRTAGAGGLHIDVLGGSRFALAGHEVHVPAPTLFESVSWPDVVRVDLRVRNVGGAPLLVSPGQFRLLVAGGLSVMPTAWRHGPGPLAAGAARRGWIEYRAPRDAGPVTLEFTPAGRPEPVRLPLLAVPGGPT
jgi:hypothetical protein